MSVSMVVFWGLLILGGIAVVRALNGRSPGGTPPERRPTPEEVLDERFARGEIDEEEYRRRLDVLHARLSGYDHKP
jgi:putative membrane protein